jgi:spermidine synthase
MKALHLLLAVLPGALAESLAGPAVTVFETTSAYHHILVLDQDGLRTLSFDGSTETQMSLSDPTKGHFEYTEYFHMPWLWNDRLTNVLMIGLGGASTQRAYQRLYPEVAMETVEIDPVVAHVARQYFNLQETPTQRVQISDGRVFLRRASTRYGAILVDAYVHNRYGSSIPFHLATKEFFQLAAGHLGTNGVLAYNVIGTMQGWRADLLGAIARTMKTVFPQVYYFPAKESQNVVILATMSAERVAFYALQQRVVAWTRSQRAILPDFSRRAHSFQAEPPANFDRCPVLTDDYAPIDGLSRMDY